MKKKSKSSIEYSGASMEEVFNHVHREVVRYCSNCGKPMTRSEENDYGSLCERCYMREYYDE